MSPEFVYLPFWVLEVVLALAFLLIFLAFALCVAAARRPKRPRPGYITEDMIREIRFFDDQWEPKR